MEAIKEYCSKKLKEDKECFKTHDFSDIKIIKSYPFWRVSSKTTNWHDIYFIELPKNELIEILKNKFINLKNGGIK